MNEERKDWPLVAYGFVLVYLSLSSGERNLGCLKAFPLTMKPIVYYTSLGLTVKTQRLSTQWTYLLRVIITKDSDFFLIQNLPLVHPNGRKLFFEVETEYLYIQIFNRRSFRPYLFLINFWNK